MKRLLQTLKEDTTIFELSSFGPLVSENKWHTVSRSSHRIILTQEYRTMADFLTLRFAQTRSEILNKPIPKNWHPQTYEFLRNPPSDCYYIIYLGLWLWRRADTGNYLKPIGDALEDAGVIKNDRYILDIVLERNFIPKGITPLFGLRICVVPPRFYKEISDQQKGILTERQQETH